MPNTYLEKFYHHLFRSDRDAIALIDELGLGSRLVWPRPTTACLVHGRAWPLDSALRVLRFGPLSPLDRLRLGAAIAYLKLERQHQRLEGRTAAPWIRRMMGRRVYDLVWGPQLASKFGAYAEQIALSLVLGAGCISAASRSATCAVAFSTSTPRWYGRSSSTAGECS